MRRAASAAVIGGGFYGACLAVHLSRRVGRVVLFEREAALMTRASRINQARLHAGYHYPRSFLTAARSHANLAVFREQHPEAIEGGFRHIYAIARNDSKVGKRHFERLFTTVGLTLRPVPASLAGLFDPRLIEAIYEVEEPAFNIDILRHKIAGQLAASGVDIRLNTQIGAMSVVSGTPAVTEAATGATTAFEWVFNCTYAGLNQITAPDPAHRPQLAHQVAELALIEPPAELFGLGITIVDGPFFSVMPFPSEGLHSFSHVRYTPHLKWTEAASPEHDPATIARDWPGPSRFEWMVRDAQRYVPAIGRARHIRSLYEVKTLVTGTEMDDSRPILLHQDAGEPRIISILGAKIDNIFDVYVYVDRLLNDYGT